MDEKDEVAAPAEKPVAKIVSTKAREKTVPLEWPIEYDGVIYESITVRRCTGAEISEYVMARATGDDALFPGISCPIAVYEALDADDLEQVDVVVKDFLPRSFRQAGELPPEASDSSSTKSDTPSGAAAPK